MQSARNTNLLTAFRESHNGYALDAVICNDELRNALIRRAKKTNPGMSEFDVLWGLMTIRKSAEMNALTTRHLTQDHSGYQQAADRAARSVENSHGSSIDRTLCNPQHRAEFDGIAARIVETEQLGPCSPEQLRLAALRTRKLGQDR